MKTVVTIGRQYGSGGHEIGKRLAELLELPFYDKELISRTAKDSGFCPEMIEAHDERPTSSFLYNLVMDTYSFGFSSSSVEMPLSQKIFLAQFDAIKKLASEGPCVIVGRCANYALDDNERHLNIFISSYEGHRIERILERHPDITSADKAREAMNKMDKQRRNYNDYYSTKKWGYSDSYDLCVNSSLLGIEGTAVMLAEFVRRFDEGREKA